MHILDGHLPSETIALGFAGAGLLTAATLPRLNAVSPPRVAMMASAFFAASLLSVPLGGTSVHLSLVGLCGVVLGRAAFPAILVGVALQYQMFGHGGLTTIGVNATTMGVGALVAGGLFHVGGTRSAGRAAVAAGLGTLAALLLYGLALLSAGEALRAVAWVCLALHAPVVLVEALMAGLVARFLLRVQPELLGIEPAPPASEPEPAVAEAEATR